MNINTSTRLGKKFLKSNLHPRFFTSLFFLSLIFLSGCISKGKIDIVLASSKNQTVALNVNIANIQVINNQIVLTGTNLNAVTEFKIKNGASITALEIESKSNTSLVANTLANVNFAVGAIFDFILSNANAASTFQVNFSLCDSLLGGKGFDCLIVPNDKDVLSFDAASNKWIPRNVNGLTYKGTFNASPGVDPVGSPLSGDYYLISAAGVINTVSYAIGDWIVYNADDSAWQKVSNSQDVLSVFGRTGKISAKEGDYNLTKMSDVDLTTVAPVLDQILKFNGTNWVPGTLVLPAAATGSAGAPSYSFSGNTNTGIFSPGTNQVAITSNGVERLRVDASGNVGIGTAAPTKRLTIVGGDALINSITVGLGGGSLATNLAMGEGALQANTTGATNTAIGSWALQGVTSGNNNTGVGFNALYASNGSGNTAVGASAGEQSTTGDGNSFFGQYSGYSSTGSKSSFYGFAAGLNATGDKNTLVGYRAGRDITTGAGNIYLGTITTTGNGVTTGSNNIQIGNDLTYGLNQSGSNQLNVGNLIFATGLSSGSTLSTGNVGIGTTTPRSALDVNGSVQVGVDGAACSATKAGAMRFATPNVEYCNGTAWISISGGLSIPNGTQGGIPWYSATGAISSSSQLLLNGIVLGGGTTAPSTIGLGTANYVLTSNGVGGPPTWEAPASGLPADAGSAAAPSYSFTGFTTTGMYLDGTDVLGFSTAGSERMRISASGNVGIGSTNPQSALSVQGAIVSESVSNTGAYIDFNQGNVQMSSTAASTINICGLKDGGSYTLVLTGVAADSLVTINAFPTYVNSTSCSGTAIQVDLSGGNSTFTTGGNTNILSFVYFSARGANGTVYGFPATNYNY